MEPTQTDPTQTPQSQPGAIVVPQLENSPSVMPVVAAPVDVVTIPGTKQAESLTEVELPNEADTEIDELSNESEEPAFQWQASEYVQHHKGGGWYVGLATIVLALLAIAFFTQQWLSIAVFLVMATAVVVYAHKPPRILLYQLDSNGIIIENKPYNYSQFRSFAVLQDLTWHAIDLEPTQRFMPRLTVIFDDEDFDSIVDHLTLHLPRADRQPDMVERLTRYLRF